MISKAFATPISSAIEVASHVRLGFVYVQKDTSIDGSFTQLVSFMFSFYFFVLRSSLSLYGSLLFQTHTKKDGPKSIYLV